MPIQLIAPIPPGEVETKEKDCLKNCLEKLPAEKRDLLLNYYEISETSDNYIRQRRELSERCSMRLETLYTAICRLRTKVSACTKGCVENMSANDNTPR